MEKFCTANKMIVISNVHYPKVNIEQTPGFHQRSSLLFIGSKHLPNLDSVQFLHEDIMPRIWETNPDVELHVVGDVNTLLNISHPKIKLLGHVPDITGYFLNSKLMVAPLRYGAGVKGKIGQAFEYYLPVVTSQIGAEGMKLVDGETVLLAETADEFAEKILLLYTDEVLWKKIQANSERGLRPFSRETLFDKIKLVESQSKKGKSC
jgi:glycosyltransferase involved in cell wall biosynthesis